MCFAPPTNAQSTATTDPSALLQQMYLSSGGRAWDRIAGANLTGDYDLGGLKGTFHQLIDFRRGRDVLAYDVGTTRSQQGIDRQKSWWTDEKGLTTIQESPEALADSAAQSYQDRNGWFHPDPQTPTAYVGQRVENGRSFDLVRVEPPGGRALTLWIDTLTHRLDRFVTVDAAQRQNTTYFSDYRQVAEVWYPFVQRSSTGDPASDVIASVKNFAVRSALPDRAFIPPRSVVRDARLGQSGQAAIPFTLKGGLIVVPVSIEGKPPLPFLLDSGASNFLTPEAAQKLDVAAKGTVTANGVGNDTMNASLARVSSYRVGPAELFDQRFVILPLPSVVTQNGNAEPIAGLIGYEVLRRFIVRIDYHRREVTILSPESKRQPAWGAALPLFFNGRDSFVKAGIDGNQGYFGIDTGDDGGLTLFQGFYTAHSIPIAWPGIKLSQGGVGGETATLLTRVTSLSLGPYTLPRPLTDLHFATGGVFASKLTGGNIGSEVFRNFILTFDYTHRVLYLEKSPDFGYSVPYNRTGLHLDGKDPANLLIKTVDEGSPAAVAGLRTGDQLVSLDRRPVRGTAYSTVQDWLLAARDPFDIEIQRDGRTLHITVTPKDLLPVDGPLQLKPAPF